VISVAECFFCVVRVFRGLKTVVRGSWSVTRGSYWIPAPDQVEGRLASLLAMAKSNPCKSRVHSCLRRLAGWRVTLLKRDLLSIQGAAFSIRLTQIQGPYVSNIVTHTFYCFDSMEMLSSVWSVGQSPSHQRSPQPCGLNAGVRFFSRTFAWRYASV